MSKWYEATEEEELIQIDEDTIGVKQKPTVVREFVLVDYEPPILKPIFHFKNYLSLPEPKKYPLAIRQNCLPAKQYILNKEPQPKYEMVVYHKYLLDLSPLNRIPVHIVYLALQQKRYNPYPIRLPFKVYFNLIDPKTVYDWSLAIWWLSTPEWKKWYYYFKYRYSLLQKAISSEYKNPTFARMSTDGVSLIFRWITRYYRKGVDILCAWVRYVIRAIYKQFLGDQSQILQVAVTCAMCVLLSFSYMAVSDVYTDAHTISEFGHNFNVKSELRYELGDPVILEPIYFLEDDSLDYATKVRLKTELLTSDNYRYDENTKAVRGYGVSILPSGTYIVQLGYRDQIRECKLIVEDTTPPDLSECDLFNSRTIRVLKGTQQLDLKGMLSAGIQDASLMEQRGFDTSSLRIMANTNNLNTSKRGKYYIDVTVEDKYGNTTEPLRITVYVVDYL